jgi:hypothetical protein
MRAIALTETGGNRGCDDIIGGSGEITCLQYMPDIYKAYSKQVLGYVAKPSRTSAEYIAAGKVQEWLEQGLSEREIFLMWNAGKKTGCSAGVNKYGVSYDSCKYVEKAVAYYSR